ncbi:MAG TPA: flagellin, partial [Candidatus Binatia bacterium]|nr:flagellin [Candidatus Binatia bacterium]
MPIGILNNIPSLAAENELTLTSAALNTTLEQLSSGSRINTGADDPAGLAIANGLQANVAALTQSVANANDGVGELQLADGALAQVTNLLDTAVTLATESATGTVSDSQRTAIQAQYASILAEINRIGTATTYNSQEVFQSGTAPNLNAQVTPASAGTINPNETLTPGSTTTISVGNLTPLTFTASSSTNTTPNIKTDSADSFATNGLATALTTGKTFILTRASGAVTLTTGAGATLGSLLSTINSGTAGTGITITSNTDTNFAAGNTGYQATLSSAGHVSVNDLQQEGDLAISGTDVGASDFAGGFANGNTTSTVQSLINAVNNDSALGLQASIVNGQLQISDPQARGDVTVTTNDGVLGAQSGAVTNFTTPQTTGLSEPDLNQLVSSASYANTSTALGATSGQVFSFTAGGNTFKYTATGAESVGTLINAINNPTSDPAGLEAYLNTSGNLVVVDPNNNGDLAVGSANTETVLGNLTNPQTTGIANPTNIFLSDSTAIGSSQIAVTIGALSASSISNGSGANTVNLSTTDLSSATDAQAALTQINRAIANVASTRGVLGASVNRLTDASNVINSQVQNLTSAENTITAADIPTAV